MKKHNKLIVSITLALIMTAGSLVTLSAKRQPEMRAALNALRNAESHLKRASHDKGGHRARALRMVREAMKEVKKGMRFDKRHK